MLQTYRLTLNYHVALDETPTLISELESRGWIPAVASTDRTFRQIAGIEQSIGFRQTTEHVRRPTGDLQFRGDIFFRESDLYYLVRTSQIQVPTRTINKSGRPDYEIVTTPARIELGILTEKADGLDERLRSFAAAVSDSLRHLNKNPADTSTRIHARWQSPAPVSTRLAAIVERAEEDNVKFEPANFKTGDLEGAEVLANSPLAVQFLQSLSQAGFLRRRDMQARQGKRHEGMSAALDVLSSIDIINTETLLECKKTGSPLTRLANTEQLKIPEVANLTCPGCGSRFAAESTSEGYSVSELGRRLITKSHWMTVWLTKQLYDLSVEQSSVLWNLAETGEEVDVVADFLGELWVFELKDREFGSGDAHAFNYRRVRYQPTKAFIVTTDKVSKDAKRVFDDLAKDAQPRGTPPIYVEGLSAVLFSLKSEMSKSSLNFACRRLEQLGQALGYDLSSLVSAKYQDAPVLSPEGQTDTE